MFSLFGNYFPHGYTFSLPLVSHVTPPVQDICHQSAANNHPKAAKQSWLQIQQIRAMAIFFRQT